MTETRKMIIRVKKSKVASLWNFPEGEIVTVQTSSPEEKKSFLQVEEEKEQHKQMKKKLRELAKQKK